MTLLEDAPDFTLWHDASCACLYATWRGYHPARLTQAHYTLIRQQRQRTQSTKLLNDSLLDEDGWAALTRWLADEYFQALAAEGLQALAWVLPRQPAALYDTAWVVARLQQPLADTFTDAQAAYDWLHRWPAVLPKPLAMEPPLTAAAFLLLPAAQQVALAAQQGRAMAPRWETDFYVKPYQLLDALVIDVYYHLHSGGLYQVQVRFL
jgi:hypothetical protein